MTGFDRDPFPNVPEEPFGGESDAPSRFPKRDSGRPSGHPFQAIYDRSTDLVGFSQAGNTVVSATLSHVDKAGNKVYTVTLRTAFGNIVQKKWAVDSEARKFIAPATSATAAPPGAGEATSDVDQLRKAKDNWASWVVEMTDSEVLTATSGAGFLRNIQNFTGTAAELNDYMQFVQTNTFPAPGDFTAEFGPGEDFFFGGGGGGGGGSGFTGPEYAEPDRRVIEDLVKGTLVSLVGEVTPDLDRLVDLYFKDHRANFDTPLEEINASQSVVEAVRLTDGYQRIHELRPDATDERTWISDRFAQGEAGGLATGRLGDFAISQATVGAQIGNVRQAAAVNQFERSGQAPDFLDRQFRQAAQGVLRGVRR